MATKDTLKQLEMIDTLKTRLQSLMDDLDVLRRSIEECEKKAYNPSSANGVTLDDVFKALEKKSHRNSRFKLRELCRSNNISSLDEFLKISPNAFVHYKGIGPTTAYQVRVAIESLGIVWSDATLI